MATKLGMNDSRNIMIHLKFEQSYKLSTIMTDLNESVTHFLLHECIAARYYQVAWNTLDDAGSDMPEVQEDH